MTKQELRKLYKTKRAAFAQAELSLYNAAILAQLKAIDLQGLRYLHTFLPIEKLNEPNIFPFIDYLRQEQPAIKIVISRSNPADHSMQHFLFTEELALRENQWGILEPAAGEEVAEPMLDLVLVPLLVADAKGNRVGYGKGFYDRFLAKCRPECRKVGISFFDPIDRISDVDEYDIPLDALLTPNGRFDYS